MSHPQNLHLSFAPHSSRAGSWPGDFLSVSHAEGASLSVQAQAIGCALRGGRPYQQDAFHCQSLHCKDQSSCAFLAIVCDGHGKHAEELSELLACDIFPRLLQQALQTMTLQELEKMRETTWNQLLQEIFQEGQVLLLDSMTREQSLPLEFFVRCPYGNRKRREKVMGQPVPLRDGRVWESGSTVVMALAYPAQKKNKWCVVTAHCGDSECFLGRDGLPMESLTPPHNIRNKEERIRLRQWERSLRENDSCLERIKLKKRRGRVYYQSSGFRQGQRFSVEPTRSMGHPLLSAMGLSFLPVVSLVCTQDRGPLTLLLASDGATDIVDWAQEEPENVWRVPEAFVQELDTLLKEVCRDPRHKNMDNTTLLSLRLEMK